MQEVRNPFSTPVSPSIRRFSSISSATSIPSSSSHIFQDTNSGGIRVIVRVRPLPKHEATSNSIVNVLPDADKKPNCIEILPPNQQLRNTSKSKFFTFDCIADATTTQEKMFELIGKPIVDSCIAGYNASCFTYGQTGSAMLGPQDDYSQKGLIQRILEDILFEIQNRRSDSVQFLCKCSFLEIYNERISDLLNRTTAEPLRIREEANVPYVENLTQETIKNANDAMTLLKKGIAYRHTSATAMNSESSRSHSIFTIIIESKETTHGGLVKTKTSRLNLIDLAGSERQNSTKTDGDSLKEACNINSSLSALGRVISGLVDQAKGKSVHVHYRDCILTYLLKDSLGGNSKTCIIANISSSASNYSETLSTLQFAQSARQLKTKPVLNEQMTANPQLLYEEIRALRNENSRLKSLMPPSLLQSASIRNDIPSVSEDVMIDEEEEMLEPQPVVVSKDEDVNRLELLYLDAMTEKAYVENKLIEAQNMIERFEAIAAGKEKLLACARLALKLKETKLAALERRTPELQYSFDNLVEEDDIEEKLDEAEAKYLARLTKFLRNPNVDWNSEEANLLLVQSREFLMQKVLHPEQHPTVLSFAVENLTLREQLEELEQRYGATFTADNSEIQELKLIQERLNEQIKSLVLEKHNLQMQVNTKKNEMNETSNQVSSIEYRNAELEGKVEELELLISELRSSNAKLSDEFELAKQIEKELLGAKLILENELLQTQQALSNYQEKYNIMQQTIEKYKNEIIESEIIRKTTLQEFEQQESIINEFKAKELDYLELIRAYELEKEHTDERQADTIVQLQNQILEMQQSVQALTAKEAVLQNSLETKEDEMKLMRTKMESEIQNLTTQIQCLKEENHTLVSEKAALKTKSLISESTQQKLKSEMEILHSKYIKAAAKAEVLQQKSDELEKFKNDFLEIYEQQQAAMSTANMEILQENQRLTKQINNLMKEMKELKDHSEKVESKAYSVLSNRVASPNQKLLEQQQLLVQKMIQEKQEMQQRMELLIKEKESKFETEKQELGNKYSVLESEWKQYTDQILEQISDLKQKNTALEEENKKLDVEMAKLMGHTNTSQRIHHIQSVKLENNSLKNHIAKLQEQLREKEQELILRSSKKVATQGKENITPLPFNLDSTVEESTCKVKELQNNLENKEQQLNICKLHCKSIINLLAQHGIPIDSAISQNSLDSILESLVSALSGRRDKQEDSHTTIQASEDFLMHDAVHQGTERNNYFS